MSKRLRDRAHVLNLERTFGYPATDFEVHAETDHMSLLREMYAPFLDLSPGVIGSQYRESLFARPTIAEEYSALHGKIGQRALASGI